jgi:[ribosomal protein S5]-alanine N-acetyltransferase
LSRLNNLELVTARLLLRPLPPQAALALLEGDRARVGTLLQAVLSPSWPAPDLDPVLRGQATIPAPLLRFGLWAMITRDAPLVIGSLGFLGPPDAGGLVEIGYDVVPERRRQGYLTEAASALCEWILATPQVTAVTARSAATNVASIASLRRLGFSERARIGDTIHWRRPQLPS